MTIESSCLSLSGGSSICSSVDPPRRRLDDDLLPWRNELDAWPGEPSTKPFLELLLPRGDDSRLGLLILASILVSLSFMLPKLRSIEASKRCIGVIPATSPDGRLSNTGASPSFMMDYLSSTDNGIAWSTMSFRFDDRLQLQLGMCDVRMLIWQI